MAREEFVWEDLTPNEEKVLADLRSKGVKIFAAPIEIEENAESRARQFASLGITWKQVRDYPIGSKKVKVHYVPADEATYHLLTNDLGNKYRDAYRKSRCMIPGTLKPLIRCPDENKCSECPYPDCREKHQTNEISYDVMIESGFERGGQDAEVYEDPGFREIEIRMELDDVCKAIKAENPKFLVAIVLKEYRGRNVKEIAKFMNDTERNIYYYISEAKRIGKKYKEDNR